jgi:hypothetical protein
MVTKQQTYPDIFQADCLSRQVLGLIADQWTPLVIYALEEGTMRFGQLLKRIDGISKKMLTQTLRALARQRTASAGLPSSENEPKIHLQAIPDPVCTCYPSFHWPI